MPILHAHPFALFYAYMLFATAYGDTRASLIALALSLGTCAFVVQHFEALPVEAAIFLVASVVQTGLVETLRRTRDEVRELNTALECRVEERTAELRERTEELEEVNEEMEAFSYSVSHDLRAPLRAMQGFARALLEDYGVDLEADGQAYAQRIIAASARMDTLISDLLAYSRLGRAEIPLHPVNLSAVVADARAQVEEAVRARDGQVIVEEPLPQVMGHHQTLVQVMSNLLTNAVKFVQKDMRPTVRIHAETGGRLVRLWVEDNGIGIAPEHQARIFLVFERLHGSETYPGTGIGLAIVRKGMERMGGQAGVDVAPGPGSRFWIDIPRGRDTV